ncbi:Syntenin-1 [Hypsibius exemplaris]|uniref:Syntenin-1 n=1 Tax=Hypsibius exemplaris TaxID=2072580 RepID=A0A1W0XEM1_HYPEX|nr:Syntenin-1 [Hypsibius exemplaris]
MALYPTLEDMSVGNMIAASVNNNPNSSNSVNRNVNQVLFSSPIASQPHIGSPMYPTLGTTAHYAGYTSQELVRRPLLPVAATHQQWVAPLTNSSVGMAKAHISHGIRQVTLCKDGKGKAGLRLLAYDNGIFVSFVMANSPASLAGVRFGDQILQMNQANCAGWSTDKAMNALRDANGAAILLAVRDRPFERTITMLKDSANRAGFGLKNGRIEKIVEDSSAARNGILTDHHLLEVNGQNVIGLSDKEIGRILENSVRDVTIAIMPSKTFQDLTKGMATSLVRESMDHRCN